MKYWLILLLSFGIFTATISGQTLHREIERIIIHDTDIKYDLTPGFIIGIIDGDSTYIESFGGYVDRRDLSIQPEDVFEVGSLTKLWTAALIDIAVQEQVLGLTDKVNQYLPTPFVNPRLEDLTINDLLHHQTPFTRRPIGFGKKEVDPQDPYAFYTKSDLLEAYSFVVAREEASVYSHMNYAMLELVLEYAYQSRYAELLKDKLLGPLNMEESFIYVGEDGQDKIIKGVDRTGTITPHWTFSSFAASEGGKSSVADLIRFMRAHLQEDETTVLLKDNFNEKYPSFGEDVFVSYGWQIIDINKRLDAAIHTGHTDGHSAFIGLVPQTKTGVVVLANSTFGTRDLGMLILRMINDNWKRKPN